MFDIGQVFDVIRDGKVWNQWVVDDRSANLHRLKNRFQEQVLSTTEIQTHLDAGEWVLHTDGMSV